MKRVAAFLAMTLLMVAKAAASPQPDDFIGHWQVSRMVGASDIGTGSDYRKVLGSKLEWSAGAVRDADGICRFATPAVTPVSRQTLEQDLWGGQPINGLSISKSDRNGAFGRPAIPVFDDGGKDCARAVMLDRDRLLLMFSNGYLYLLNRVYEKR